MPYLITLEKDGNVKNQLRFNFYGTAIDFLVESEEELDEYQVHIQKEEEADF